MESGRVKILNVVGARPNFIKIAPILKEMQKHNDIEPILVHTGQHYDDSMAKIFFNDLDIPRPNVDLGIGAGSHAEQTAKIMLAFETLCFDENPDLILVVGDVNSTLACSLVASKLNILLVHVEAGLRSGDRKMPEEINRIVTDALSDFLFTTSLDANDNLRAEGIPPEKIFFVGNVMIDSLLKYKAKAQNSRIFNRLDLRKNNLISNRTEVEDYCLITLHRPSNVDSKEVLGELLDAIWEIQKSIRVIFPIHPRTQRQIDSFGFGKILENMSRLSVLPPLGYLDFIALLIRARMVLTDSGGVQEETTVLGIPCLTLRENTERPVTVWEGTNTLVGMNKERIVHLTHEIIEGRGKKGQLPKYWEGRAAQRIVKVLREKLGRLC
jgi:UDP-N-acetylglucosamine 2-epimerase (non-hydrolysing)